jgi:hypothetical protein
VAEKILRFFCSFVLFTTGLALLAMGHLLVIGAHVGPRPAVGFGLSVAGLEIALLSYPVIRRTRAEALFRAGLYLLLFLGTIWPGASYLVGHLLSIGLLAPVQLTQHQTSALIALMFVGAANLFVLYRWGGLASRPTAPRRVRKLKS